ncbi:phosphonate ABC transporter, permease protein PhnE [Salipaludibacillus sp. LMS25]|jgi:phosphonate transport system permease protein|uniref:phosphonate ABC transporter, permease protein PhnE n=1 Tax=Salipaludibacillus sp. LMS25 TaxID=2924031 RepID=UPI0020D14D85|nr:phosphonate ABC transporter, permease protein PhnE [Salipaludibacillus sp. LMS25]UTR13361.1 phosphonate ABC transporter, permease protein PhnE [Salipaludibacillus sp. LMS25]
MTPYMNQKKQLTKAIYISLFLFIFIVSLLQIGILDSRLFEAASRVESLLISMFPPVISEPIDIAGAAMESLQVTIMGTLWGMIFSIVLAMFAAKNVAPHISISYGVKAFAAFVRAVPALIWALLFIVAVGLGPTPGILALAVNSVGMLVKVYAEAIEEIDHGVIDALKATGASKFQLVMQGVIPSVMSSIISWSIFRFDINIRYAAVLGVVGAGGIGWELVRASRIMAYDEVLGITLVIFAMILCAELLTRYLKMKSDMVTLKAME